ncbi:HET-domain-containing protein [Apiospora hydei]|uniref:HET-domain-containing protein n=1 Tax=Apiospora hydei TaxID=1337664 RepID=A0ABR1X488_9PEZI
MRNLESSMPKAQADGQAGSVPFPAACVIRLGCVAGYVFWEAALIQFFNFHCSLSEGAWGIMWLIDTRTLKLVFKTDPSEIDYAILSHTWEEEEVSFQEFQDMRRARRKKGFNKIEMTCRLARMKYSLKYAWVDTCCIDKSSSAELSEAINSMFRYYKLSFICFVYLCDLSSDTSPGPGPIPGPPPSFSQCRWLTRGWTLQELIAPCYLSFFDESWSLRGSKDDWADSLSSITSIPSGALSGWRQLDDYSVAARFSWAAKRQTTRKEDLAYCLLGIFGVYIPLLYGESENAFLRLQEEISRSTNDMSIFAWQAVPEDERRFSGMYAKYPAEFVHCASVTRMPSASRHDKEYSLTNKGLRFDHVLTTFAENADYIKPSKLSASGGLERVYNERIESLGVAFLDLECFNDDPDGSSTGENSPTLGVYLTKLQGEYVRTFPNLLSAKYIRVHVAVQMDEEQLIIYAIKALTEQQSNKLEKEFHKEIIARLDISGGVYQPAMIKQVEPQSAWDHQDKSFHLWEGKDTSEISCFWLLTIDQIPLGGTIYTMECLVVCIFSREPVFGTRKALWHVFVGREGEWKIGNRIFCKPIHQVFREQTALEQFQECLRQEHDSHHRARYWVAVALSDDKLLHPTGWRDLLVTTPDSEDLEEVLLLIHQARHRNDTCPCYAHNPAKDLDTQPTGSRVLQYSSAKGHHGQSGNDDGGEEGTQLLVYVGQGVEGDGKGAGKTDEYPRRKAKHDGDGRLLIGDPSGKLGGSRHSAVNAEHNSTFWVSAP